ncbi:MAG: AbrB family transcriptional regulator [Thermoprotei archaeon]|nr:MAG: AbrB family transcriptional regulator [Thermoprotei archaeon]
MRIVTKVRKKGVLILPKRVREAAGIREGDEVLIEVGEGLLVIRPLRPKIVDVDPSLLEELLREEYRLEARKHEEILKG